MTDARRDAALGEQLARLLDWEEAHAGVESAFASLPPDRRGIRPDGHAHSPWELLEHIRLAQRDILDFCRDAGYAAKRWPDDYWPSRAAPDGDGTWEESLAALRADREALAALALDATDLLAPIPRGDGQTILRELLLAADHAAYHVGQVVLVRRALGVWPPEEAG